MTISVLVKTEWVLIGFIAQNRCLLTETDMIFGAGFGTVPDADTNFPAFQPSH